MIELTEKAIGEIRRIKDSEKDAGGTYLRIMVVGGGCSGMSYKLGFDKLPPAESDKIVEKDGIKVAIDAKSSLFLDKTVLDFTDGLNGKGFVFNNPSASKTCGCGNSFSA